MSKVKYKYRDSIKWTYTTQKFAEKHPDTTEKERVKNN